jgi:hypothetical protein
MLQWRPDHSYYQKDYFTFSPGGGGLLALALFHQLFVGRTVWLLAVVLLHDGLGNPDLEQMRILAALEKVGRPSLDSLVELVQAAVDDE